MSADVTLTSLVQAPNYNLVTLNAIAKAIKTNRDKRYKKKFEKHRSQGPCVPIVFDFSGGLHKDSLAFLSEATSGYSSKLAFFRRHAAAIIYRMVAQLDERNFRQLMERQSPSDVAEDQAAFELWQEQGEALGYDADDSTTDILLATDCTESSP